MTNLKLLIVLLVTISTATLFAQTEKEKIQQIETQKQMDKQRKLTTKLDSAIRLSEEGQYEQADVKFKAVLKEIRSVPTDLTYHFGKNSFLLGKYKQSVDWLTKYVQLKGTSGQFSEAAVGWLSQAEL